MVAEAHRRWHRATSLVPAFVLAGVLAASPVGPAPAAAGAATAAEAGAASGERSFEIVSVETDAVIGADGSMTVEERVTYRFEGGPFRQGLRTFDPDELDRIVGFSAEEDGVGLPVYGPPASGVDGFAWDFPEPVSDSTHTYIVRYEVPDAVAVGTDVGELYWQFIGTQHPGIGSVAVDIELPGTFQPAAPDTPDDETEVLRAWAHGPSNGTVALQPTAVTLDVAGVPAETFVEARVAIPASAFTVDPVSGDRLPGILAEERAFIEDAESEETQRAVGGWTAVVTAIAGLLATVGLWFRFGREPKVPGIGQYWREPLEDPPPVVLATLSRGNVAPSQGMASSIVDLAQRGHLSIAEEVIERFGPDKRVHRFTRRQPRTPDALAPYEQVLVDYLFSAGDSVTTDDIEQRAKKDQSGSKALLDRWKHLVRDAYKARGYGDPGGLHRRWWLLGGIALVMIGAGLLALALGTMIGLVPLIAVVPVVVGGALLLHNRSQAGAEAAAKAKALRSFLKDFSNLEEAPSGHLILWERYLVYAVTLGVSRQLLNGISSRMPQLMSDPAFGAWYVGAAGARRLDGLSDFPGSFESTAMKGISPPSSSGSGGGFSGGGGGGGGGGGFGAR